MTDGGSVGNADLVELSLEEEWPRLRSQLELHGTTWLTFLFCSSTEQAGDLLGRTQAQLRATGREMAVVAATEREAIVNLVDTLLRTASPAGALTWVDGVASGLKRREATISWEQALLRANDHRDALLRRHPDGLVLCLPIELKTAVSEAAPDLWAMRVLAMEVDPPFRLVPVTESRSTDVPAGPAEDLVVAPPLDARAASRGRVLRAELSRARALRAAGNELEATALLEGALARDAPPSERAQALTELAAARAAQDDVAGAIRTLEQALSTGGLTRRQLERSTEQLEALAGRDGRPELAVAAARARVALLRDAEPAQLAGALNNLSNSLAGLGRSEDALAAVEESVAIYRALAEARPDAFLSDLAMSLNDLSGRLSGLGRREDALAAVEESVALHRTLADASVDAFLPKLAMSLNDLSNSLSDLGRREDALAAVEESVALYRAMAEARSEAFLPDLAISLDSLSSSLSSLGRRKDALAAADEAVRVVLHALERAPRLPPDAGLRFARRYAEAAEAAGHRDDELWERLLAVLPSASPPGAT